MIRRILSLFVCACGLIFVVACNSEEKAEETNATTKVDTMVDAERLDITELSASKVYFFYQETCPHCHEAAAYLHEKHPNAKIKALNIKMSGNMNLFTEAVQTYEIGPRAGTPLICFGKEYIMGWGPEDQEQLEKLIVGYE